MLRPPHHLAPLLRILRSPASAPNLEEAEWDRVLRMARCARLHGVLAYRLERVDPRRLPHVVLAQLESARAEARHARQMLIYELAQVQAALAGMDVDVVLLKGAAYLAQNLECSRGRLPSDLDIMVRRAHLEQVEQRLLDAGWQGTELSEYDRAYYRRWAHQVPPLRAAGHAMEVDLHHAILPPLGRIRIPVEELWKASRPVGGGRVRVLAPEDQVLHAVVHLFVDSDCTNRLRDLLDIGALLTQFARDDPSFVTRLIDRAIKLGAARPLEHAGVFLAQWLGLRLLAPLPTSATARAALSLMARRLAPPDPDAMPARFDGPHSMLLARSLWLRLPPHLALLHAGNKAARRVAGS